MNKVSDPLFILNTTKKTYVSLNEDKYLELQNGQIHLWASVPFSTVETKYML